MINPITEHFYDELYTSIDAVGSVGRFHRLTHRVLEKAIQVSNADSILELGVNRGEHIEFVTQSVKQYVATDFRPTVLRASRHSDVLTQAICSAEKLPFPNKSFDRVIVTCLLHHLAQPYAAVQECRRVVRPGGMVSVLLPCDPGLAYRLGWHVTSGRRLRKLGVPNPRIYHALEHTGHFEALHQIIHHGFSDCDIQEVWWPLRVKTWNLNLFVAVTVRC